MGSDGARPTAARRLPRSGWRCADRRADQGHPHRAQPSRHRGRSRRAARARTTPRRGQRSRDARGAGRTPGTRARPSRHDRAGGARSTTACGRRNRGGVEARVQLRRCAGRGRIRHDQRPLQIRGGEGRQAVCGVRHGPVDERLHVDERRDHGRRAQEDAAGRDAAGGVHGSRGARGGARADDPRRPRRFALPADGAGRLAALAPSRRHARTGARRSRCWRRTNRSCWTRPRH